MMKKLILIVLVLAISAPIEAHAYATDDGCGNFFAWSPHDTYILCINPRDPSSVTLYRAIDLERVARLQHPEVALASFNPDETQLLTMGYDRYLRVWSIPDAELVSEIKVGVFPRGDWNADGSLIYASSSMGVGIWNPQTGEQLYQNDLASIINPGWIGNTNRLMLRDETDSKLLILDANNFTITAAAQFDERIYQVLWNQDDSQIAIQLVDGKLCIYDALLAELQFQIQVQGVILNIDWNTNNELLIHSRITATQNNMASHEQVLRWNPRQNTTPQLIDEQSVAERIDDVRWQPNGSLYAIEFWNDIFQIWDGAELIYEYRGQAWRENPNARLEWDRHGRYLLMWTTDARILLWDSLSRSLAASYQHPTITEDDRIWGGMNHAATHIAISDGNKLSLLEITTLITQSPPS